MQLPAAPPPYPNYGGIMTTKNSSGNGSRSRSRDPREGPPWLEPFLSARYFDACKVHVFNKNEKNHFCIDCVEGPLCGRGLRDHTNNVQGGAPHRTLQVRRASHADGVRVENIAKLIDISGIQTYIINNHRIVFLLRQAKGSASAGSGYGGGVTAPYPNPTPSSSGSLSRHCQSCGRVLSSDPMRFCSIKCKLLAIKQQQQQPSTVVDSSSTGSFLTLSLCPPPPSSSPWLLHPDYGYGGPASLPGGMSASCFEDLRRKFNLSLATPDSPKLHHHGQSLLSPVSVLHVLKRPPPLPPPVGSCGGAARSAADYVNAAVKGDQDYIEEEEEAEQRRRLQMIEGILQRRKRRKGSPRRAPLF